MPLIIQNKEFHKILPLLFRFITMKITFIMTIIIMNKSKYSRKINMMIKLFTKINRIFINLIKKIEKEIKAGKILLVK